MKMMRANGQLLLQVAYLPLSRFWRLDLQKQKRTLQPLLEISVITVKIFLHVLKVKMLYVVPTLIWFLKNGIPSGK